MLDNPRAQKCFGSSMYMMFLLYGRKCFVSYLVYIHAEAQIELDQIKFSTMKESVTRFLSLCALF